MENNKVGALTFVLPAFVLMPFAPKRCASALRAFVLIQLVLKMCDLLSGDDDYCSDDIFSMGILL